MSYNTQNIIDQIQAKINDTTFPVSELITYIANTNNEIHNQNELRYMQSKASFVTTAGQAILGTTPVDLQIAYNLRRTDIQFAGKINWIDFDKFDEMYPQPSILAPSTPMVAYSFSSVINLFPTPNQPSNLSGYGIELRYLRKPTQLTQATDIPDVPEEFKELLFLGAFAQAMEKRNRYDVAQEIQGQFETKKIDLLARYSLGGMHNSDAIIIDNPWMS